MEKDRLDLLKTIKIPIKQKMMHLIWHLFNYLQFEKINSFCVSILQICLIMHYQ